MLPCVLPFPWLSFPCSLPCRPKDHARRAFDPECPRSPTRCFDARRMCTPGSMAAGPVVRVHHIYEDDEYFGAYVGATEQNDIFRESLWRAYQVFDVARFDDFRIHEVCDGGDSSDPVDQKVLELARMKDLQDYPRLMVSFTDECEAYALTTMGWAAGANKKLRQQAAALALVAARRRQLAENGCNDDEAGQEGIEHVDVHVVTPDTEDEGQACVSTLGRAVPATSAASSAASSRRLMESAVPAASAALPTLPSRRSRSRTRSPVRLVPRSPVRLVPRSLKRSRRRRG